jgi:hypothetical protein
MRTLQHHKKTKTVNCGHQPEKFPNLKKEMSIQVQEASSTLKRDDQNRTSPQHIIVKTISRKPRKLLKALREKNRITCKGKPIKITAELITETLKAGRTWSEVLEHLKKTISALLHPAKLSLKMKEK